MFDVTLHKRDGAALCLDIPRSDPEWKGGSHDPVELKRDFGQRRDQVRPDHVSLVYEGSIKGGRQNYLLWYH